MRAVAVGGRENLMSLYMTAGLLALFAAYESAILLRVDRAIQTRRDFTNWVWFANTVLETTLPAVAVAFVSSSSIDPAYKPLADPAGLGFFLFISLLTLRLDPTLCRISGLTAAVSYLAAAVHLVGAPQISRWHDRSSNPCSQHDTGNRRLCDRKDGTGPRIRRVETTMTGRFFRMGPWWRNWPL